MDVFSYGDVWRDLCRSDSEISGGKRPFFGYDLGGASACDQVAVHVEVVPAAGAPRPEARPSGLLAGAVRKGRLLEGRSGQEAHFGLALGAVAPSRVGKAAFVEFCDLLVFTCREKALERLRLCSRDEIAPKIGACNVYEALRPVFDWVERAVCLALKRLDCVEDGTVFPKLAVA